MLAAPVSPHEEKDRRLAVKVRRELGEEVLGLLADSRTENILLTSLADPG